MSQKIDLDQIQLKLYEKLGPSGWGNKLKSFIMSQDFKHILEVLLKESESGLHFTPKLNQLFRCFTECPYSELKVCVLGLDPYPSANQADGIAFSCSNTMKPAASLRYILKEVADTVYPGKEYEWNPDLKRWSNQGILMLNTALTTRVGSIGAHIDLWRPFMTFLFDMLENNNNGLVYAYLGRGAQEWAPMVSDDRNWKLFARHPASASYNNEVCWDSGNLFIKVQHLVQQNFKYTITW